MAYFKFILSFDIILVSLVIVYAVSANIHAWYERKHPQPPMTKEELDYARKYDKTSAFYLPPDVRRDS